MEERLSRSARAERMALAGGELLVDVAGDTATVTLNRPAALNALTYPMLQALDECLDAWERDATIARIVFRGAGERAFCAGGDVRAVQREFVERGEIPLYFFAFEYALDRRIHEYPKPIAALMDGIVMGGGMGVSQGTRLRVVGDRTRMAMPETAIGLFPDVGGSYFLSRVPGKLGLYLGLVGVTIRAADALYCGLADVYLDRAAIDDFEFEHAQLKGCRDLPSPPLERLRPAIDEHFAQGSVDAIVASLGREEREPYRAWAAETRAALAKRSPTLLDVTFEQIRRGATLSLADCFAMELQLIERTFEHGDLVEGIRAVIVDKDQDPRWHRRADIDFFFNPRTS
jgi:enoyl-CoA hydratase/carnithine racemase